MEMSSLSILASKPISENAYLSVDMFSKSGYL